MEWYKDEEVLDGTLNASKVTLHPNNSITIFNALEEDIGVYKCRIYTGVESFSLVAELYAERDYFWLIILISCIIAFLLLVLCILCIVCVRKRSKRKGCYGVKDYEDGKRKKSGLNGTDIQYSIDEDTDSLHKPLDPYADDPKPIIKNGNTPKKSKTIDGKAAISGSENSLLNITDEDEWLKKGMDEDGSFREGHYAN